METCNVTKVIWDAPKFKILNAEEIVALKFMRMAHRISALRFTGFEYSHLVDITISDIININANFINHHTITFEGKIVDTTFFKWQSSFINSLVMLMENC